MDALPGQPATAESEDVGRNRGLAPMVEVQQQEESEVRVGEQLPLPQPKPPPTGSPAPRRRGVRVDLEESSGPAAASPGMWQPPAGHLLPFTSASASEHDSQGSRSTGSDGGLERAEHTLADASINPMKKIHRPDGTMVSPITGRVIGQVPEKRTGKQRFRALQQTLGAASILSSPKPDPSPTLPDGVDLSTPGIETAWLWFQEMDTDNSGEMDMREVAALTERLGMKVGKRAVKRAFHEMNVDGKGGVTFVDFVKWWNTQQAIARRDMRRVIKELFEEADDDRSGILEKDEFARLVDRANNNLGLPALFAGGPNDPDSDSKERFNLEQAWKEIRKVPFAEGTKVGVNFAGFEAWWKAKSGATEPDIPVLPEFMVLKINDRVRHEYASKKTWPSPMPLPGEKRQSENWSMLAAKLRTLVGMQRQWGDLHEIYETRAESLFEQAPLPPWVRDPESEFSAAWDLTSVVLLLYVAIVIPLRACFDLNVDLWSAMFWWDVIVDVFFICDVGLNFRTSFFDSNGFREERPKKMAIHYMKGWFVIDLVSCLPFGYVGYFQSEQSANDAGAGQDLKALKAFRLIRMTKLLRLARIKKILTKYGSDVNFQQYLNIGFTLFAILFLMHMLACFFFLIGVENEVLGNGVAVDGWVNANELWQTYHQNGTQIGGVSPKIGTGHKYAASLYFVLNALENGQTLAEHCYGIFAELIRDMILGLVASLMTTISMSMASSDNENSLRLKRLKLWLMQKKLPTGFQQRMMSHFNEIWTNQSSVDLPEMMDAMPPAMASTLAEYLYGRFLATVPLFKGLSPEVIGALCMRVKPMVSMKNQLITKQGESGKEMYMVMSGEVEVLEDDKRLGFLSEGAFFGESPILGFGEAGTETRRRTVKAVTETELCYVTRDSIEEICQDYPELRARLLRFANAAKPMNAKRLKKAGLTRTDLNAFSLDCEYPFAIFVVHGGLRFVIQRFLS
eukprot:COSAG02_NODE_397_length_23124_cov_439.255635_13_plen_965_part_00